VTDRTGHVTDRTGRVTDRTGHVTDRTCVILHGRHAVNPTSKDVPTCVYEVIRSVQLAPARGGRASEPPFPSAPACRPPPSRFHRARASRRAVAEDPLVVAPLCPLGASRQVVRAAVWQCATAAAEACKRRRRSEARRGGAAAGGGSSRPHRGTKVKAVSAESYIWTARTGEAHVSCRL